MGRAIGFIRPQLGSYWDWKSPVPPNSYWSSPSGSTASGCRLSARSEVACCWQDVAVTGLPAGQAMSPAATMVGSVLVRVKAAAWTAPLAVAVTGYVPAVVPAVNGGLVATPEESAVTVTVAAPPGKVPVGPVA